MANTARHALTALLTLAAATTALTYGEDAEAANIVRRPGMHAHYGFELEPHAIFQHRGPEGFGLGVRANIPLMHNGPIDSINNNMAIGFGIDFAAWDNDSYYYRGYNCRDRYDWDDCDGDGFNMWIPVVLQWNFYLTEIISVFGEAGAAMEYWDAGPVDDFDFFEPVFAGGGRFQFGDRVGLLVRVGWPYVSVGANILF